MAFEHLTCISKSFIEATKVKGHQTVSEVSAKKDPKHFQAITLFLYLYLSKKTIILPKYYLINMYLKRKYAFYYNNTIYLKQMYLFTIYVFEFVWLNIYLLSLIIRSLWAIKRCLRFVFTRIVGMESSFNIHKIDNKKWLSFNIRFGKEIPRKQLTTLPTNCKINYHTTRISFDSPKRVTMSPILYRIIRSLWITNTLASN